MENTGTVLIVDDNAAIRESLSAVLVPDHYTLLTADSGAAALAMAAAHVPDVILLDVMMPSMSGFEVCEALRRSPGLAEVPIVLITALDDRESRLNGLRVGADDFLSKPVDSLELRVRVKSIVRLNRYRRLLDERERFRNVANLSADAIVSVDEAGLITFTNHSAVRIFGEAATATERSALELLDESAQAEFARGLGDAGADAPVTAVCRTADGGTFTAEITAGHGMWRGRPSTTWVIRNVTERNRLRQRLEKAVRLEAIAAATSGLAHDFANYLMSIRMGLELMSFQVGEDPAPLLADVFSRIDDAATLVQRINVFAGGGSTALVQRVVLATVVRELEPFLRHMAGRGTVVFDLQDTPPVMADKLQLGQVVSNLVINAGHAIGPEGTITIRTCAVDGHAVLQVQDDGCGMDESTRARIFEPYFTTRAGAGGTGMGLSMVYGIVQHGGGAIELDTAPGRGTRFSLRWPLAAEAHEA